MVSRCDSAPHASLREQVRAWWGELCTAVLVFYWWQPFRRAAVPDGLDSSQLTPGQRGVVLVHGFFCNRAFWTHWLLRLRDQKRAFIAVDLEPPFGSIDEYIATIDQAVRQVRQTTGLPPVIVCHSMGGLATRAWLAACQARGEGGPGLAHRIITLGTPHHGTWLARFSHAINGRQMQQHSRWLTALKASEKMPHFAKFTCFFSLCDNIVFPVSSATLEGADNRMVRSLGHIEMAHDPQVINACWELMQ